MATINLGSDIVSEHSGEHAASGSWLAPTVAATLGLAFFVYMAAQAANPLAYLVGMAPIAWIAVEGVWRLFR